MNRSAASCSSVQATLPNASPTVNHPPPERGGRSLRPTLRRTTQRIAPPSAVPRTQATQLRTTDTRAKPAIAPQSEHPSGSSSSYAPAQSPICHARTSKKSPAKSCHTSHDGFGATLQATIVATTSAPGPRNTSHVNHGTQTQSPASRRRQRLEPTLRLRRLVKSAESARPQSSSVHAGPAMGTARGEASGHWPGFPPGNRLLVRARRPGPCCDAGRL